MLTNADQNNVIPSGNPTSVGGPSRSTSPEDNNPLKLFKLQRTPEFPAGEGEMKSAVVVAYSAVEARQKLQDFSYGDEVVLTFEEYYPFPSLLDGTSDHRRVAFWTKDMCASCDEICEATYYRLTPGVLSQDFISRRFL